MKPQILIDDCRINGVSIRLEGSALKLKGAPEAVRIAADRLRPHKAELVKFMVKRDLDQFDLDQVKREIAEGYPGDDLTRVNNMAWQFMQADGMSFDIAIKRAAEIVTACAAAQCERAYVDVMKLWEKISLERSAANDET